MRRDEDYTKLVGQHVQLVITECAGRKIVGSINKVTAEANKAKREEFWANVEVGKQYKGVVKSLTLTALSLTWAVSMACATSAS